MIKKTLEQKLKSSNIRNQTGQLIKDTYLAGLSSLCIKYIAIHETRDSDDFLAKLNAYIEKEDIEDIGQELELIKLEVIKEFPSDRFQDRFNNRVVSLITAYNIESNLEVPLSTRFSFDIDFLLGSNKFTMAQKQLWELFLLDGLTIDELADYYSTDRKVICNMIREFTEIAEELQA